MLTLNKINRVRASYIALVAGLLLLPLLTSCSCSFPDSRDGRYRAQATGGGPDVHYQVTEITTGRVILTTHAQYSTPNDVKAGCFGPDSKRFAAAYHYSHDGNYTWIGVWSTDTGAFLYSERESGWIQTIPPRVFDKLLPNAEPSPSTIPGIPATAIATNTPALVSPTATPEFAATSTPTTAPMTALMKGVAYTSWQRGQYSSSQSDMTLAQVIKPMGVNWITLLVTCYQDRIASTQIRCNDSPTPTDNDLTHAIEYAHSLGIRVMLKPHIDLTDDPDHWRGQIDFHDDEAAWEKWFESYTDAITHYATLAQNTGADYFAVGTELAGTSRRADQWRALVRAVRAKYNGPLVYAANWSEEADITWWDSVNAIGVDAYYPLTQSNQPTITQLKAAWTRTVSRLAQLSKKWGHPIIFTEIGYRSVDGANREPYNYRTSGGLDLQEQADCYQAVFETFAGQGWWRGGFWWNWTANPAQGGPADTDYTANNKPAENILRKYYGASPRRIPMSVPALLATATKFPMPPDCGTFPDSPDNRYRAKAIGGGADVHYQVIELATGRVILTTHAEYTTPNDVKAGGFSSDSKKFAAAYHYGHAGNYTWIGVWSTETGAFLYSKTGSGWTTNLCGAFDK